MIQGLRLSVKGFGFRSKGLRIRVEAFPYNRIQRLLLKVGFKERDGWFEVQGLEGLGSRI